MINTQLKFEGKIQNDSKDIMFTRNRIADDDNADKDEAKNSMSLPGPGGGT